MLILGSLNLSEELINEFVIDSQNTTAGKPSPARNLKVDIFKAEKTGKMRKFTEVDFLRRKFVPHH